jgi:predicted SAM-dependent methyltransferase
MAKIKLNLGSGPSGINGWLNYDTGVLPWLSKRPRLRHLICALGLLPESYDVDWPAIQLVDIRHRFPLEDNSVDNIYCSQVIEHFEKYEALDILKESFRVLKPGGVIRISVPDIGKMLENYNEQREKDPQTAARVMNVLWWGYEKDIKAKSIIGKVSRFFIRDHQWHYNAESMKNLLAQAGFTKAKSFPFRNGATPDLNRLEIEIHKKHSLFIEAKKEA